MKFRKHYDYNVEEASNESAITVEGDSLTVQSMAEDADINVIMKRFGVIGVMPVSPRVPMYADYTSISDYQSALNAVIAAQDGFMELPADVRERFNNNPQKLLEFVANDANIEEARKLGLLKEKVNVSESADGRWSPAGAGDSGQDPKAGGAKPGNPTGQPAVAGGSS